MLLSSSNCAPLLLESWLVGALWPKRGSRGAGVRHIQAELRRTQATHFLKTDYSRFFPSIDRARLHRLIERKIKCDKTLATIRKDVATSGPTSLPAHAAKPAPAGKPATPYSKPAVAPAQPAKPAPPPPATAAKPATGLPGMAAPPAPAKPAPAKKPATAMPGSGY